MNYLVLAGVDLLLALQGEQATVSGVIRDAAGSRALTGAVVALTELERTAPGVDSYVIPLTPGG